MILITYDLELYGLVTLYDKILQVFLTYRYILMLLQHTTFENIAAKGKIAFDRTFSTLFNNLTYIYKALPYFFKVVCCRFEGKD